jgi:heme exporter protein C
MREKVLYGLAAAATILLLRNLYMMLLVLPDEKNQGAIWRIFYFHFPAAMTAATCALTALVASSLYLIRRNLKHDALAVAATEVALVFGAMVLMTGMIWARIIWGIWWAWDARLTSTLIVWLMYASYLMLRRATDDPNERARNSAVLSIFIAPGIYITWKSIEWWRTIHPGPVISIRGGGGMAPGMESLAYWNLLALATLAVVIIAVRLRQEERIRAIESLRRAAHAF